MTQILDHVSERCRATVPGGHAGALLHVATPQTGRTTKDTMNTEEGPFRSLCSSVIFVVDPLVGGRRPDQRQRFRRGRPVQERCQPVSAALTVCQRGLMIE